MTSRIPRRVSLLSLGAAGLAGLLFVQLTGQTAPADEAASAPSACSKAESAAVVVQSFKEAEEVKYPWGWIRWLMSSKIDPKAEMTFGIVYVKPNQINPTHVHPNCEEVLHVLAGSCEHLVGDKWVTLKAGDTLRIPRGVRHVARTRGEPLRAVIAYSSGDRQFELAEKQEK